MKTHKLLMKPTCLLLLNTFLFSSPLCVFADAHIVHARYGETGMLSPQLSISMPVTLKAFTAAPTPKELRISAQNNLSQTIQKKLANADAALFSLENAFFVKDEETGELKAELTGQRTGGLGRYMGDLLARMTDNGRNVAGVGLLYNYIMVQSVNEWGEQIVRKVRIDREDLQKRGVLIPVVDKAGMQKTVKVEVSKGEIVEVKLWWAKRTTQRGEVYTLLLDNHDITSVLYIGETNSEERLRQSILLGKAGVKALEELGIRPKYFHLNEGSAALAAIYAKKNGVFRDVKITGVMHTPVEAGLPKYSEGLWNRYFYDLGPEWRTIMLEKTGTFIDMTRILFQMSRKVAAVGKEFNDVLKEMVGRMYPYSQWLLDKIEPITNGVDGWGYQPSSMDKKQLEKEKLDRKISLGEIIEARKKKIKDGQIKEILRKQLIWYAIGDLWPALVQSFRERLRHQGRSEGDISEDIVGVMQNVAEDIAAKLSIPDYEISEASLRDLLSQRGLSVPENVSLQDAVGKIRQVEPILMDLIRNRPWLCYGRRFTLYKMDFPLLDATGIERIVNNRDAGGLEYAVIFAGVAHPNDEVGKDWIRNAVELSKRHFGKFIFLPGYDLELDRLLLQNADLWLYSPERLKEACGTSGMGALFSGAIPVASPTGWSLEYVEEFNPLTGKGNGFFIEPYPDPQSDDWRAHVQGLKNVGWQGLYDKLKIASDLYYNTDRRPYFRLLENAYSSAEKTDMRIAATKYYELMEEGELTIGTHTARGTRIEDIVEITQKNHFSAIELSFYADEGLKSPGELDPKWVQDYLKPALLNKLVTVHLPVLDLRDEGSVQEMRKIIDFAADIHSYLVSIHLDELDDDFIAKVTELVIYAASKGIRLGLENSYHIKNGVEIVWHTPQHVNLVYKKIGGALAQAGIPELKENVGLVFDLAYAKIAMKRQNSPLAFYRQVDKDVPIFEVNVSGNKLPRIGALETHIPLHEDEIVLKDMPEIVQLLATERGFRGPYILSKAGDNVTKEKELISALLKDGARGVLSSGKIKARTQSLVKREAVEQAI
ncbi:MAG: glycogen/starch synthase [Candidatus Omnitrophica bacterium]|nr:glycogen/starch synthase [Candidatus Omnitrophota bacterium]MCG2703274.1 glycogen/starch synthase [Candidatus Omnitrophota bacterium]